MKNPSPYLKMRVLGAIESAPGKTRVARIRHVARMVFEDEDGNPRSFTWRTIQTWYTRYKKHGITDMTTRDRKDKGRTRKVSPEEVMEAINAALPHFKKTKSTINKMNIYRYCIEKGLLRKEQIALTTFFRIVREHDLLNTKGLETKRRLAFSMQYANQLWQADTLFGPYVKNAQGVPIQTRLIAFIDDASRVLCHGEFFLQENVDSLTKALKTAFYKRGIPEQLYVDNGSIYCSKEITLICARVGCILRHTPVRDGAAKGKIERFFRRVRQQFLAKQLDLSSLASLNALFLEWVENEYNVSVHSTLGMKPIDRFGLDLQRIRYLTPSETNDELFFAEENRKVKKDNTFSFKQIRYETPVDLRNKTIQIRFERCNPQTVIIYYNGQRMGKARPLNAVANGLRRRKEK